MAQRRARRALRKLRAFVTTRCAGGGRECDSVEGAGVGDRPAGRVDIPQHVVSVRHGVDRKEAPGRSADAEARLSWVRHAGVPVVPLDGLLVGSAPRRRLRSAERQPRLPLCLLERRGDTRLDCLVERVRVARADHDCADRLPALGRRPAQMRRAGAPADPEREPDRRQRDDCCDCRDRSPARATPRHRPHYPQVRREARNRHRPCPFWPWPGSDPEHGQEGRACVAPNRCRSGSETQRLSHLARLAVRAILPRARKAAHAMAAPDMFLLATTGVRPQTWPFGTWQPAATGVPTRY